jgi:hypothetical protein
MADLFGGLDCFLGSSQSRACFLELLEPFVLLRQRICQRMIGRDGDKAFNL